MRCSLWILKNLFIGLYSIIWKVCDCRKIEIRASRMTPRLMPQSSVLLLVSATLNISLSTLFPKQLFNKMTTVTRVAADSSAASTALQPSWYLMLSPCLNLKCHWYLKCNLEAIYFHWECWQWFLQFHLSYKDMPDKGLYRDEHLQIFWCLNTFISAIFWIFNGQIESCCQTYLVCQPEMNTF